MHGGERNKLKVYNVSVLIRPNETGDRDQDGRVSPGRRPFT